MIVPFADEHLDLAADLFAEQMREGRRHEPALSERFEEPAQARKPLEFVWNLPMSGGRVAVEDGHAVGFMLGLAFPDDVSHYALSPFSAVSHAVDGRPEILRELYAALAQDWVDAGCVGHYPTVLASEPELVQAWYSLGFGHDNTAAVRDTAAPSEQRLAPNIEIRRAGLEDLGSMQRLFNELGSHLEGSATFIVSRPEGWRTLQELGETLALEGPDVFFLALLDERAIGMQHLIPTSNGRPYLPEGCIQVEHAFTNADERGSGVGTALFTAGLAWARDSGYKRCVVHWETANLDANRFWPAHRFRPVSYQLGRRIERR